MDEYGPICAYCGTKHPERSMTLDHVAPRRGQTAYDRRDNLVLACRPCNEKKRDMAPLAFLLGSRARAGFLLKYGAHLSHGLLEMVAPLAKGLPPGMGPQREKFGPLEDDEESPYRD